MSSLVPETSFAQGASGAANVYDTSPAGLGLSPAYLSQASASASSSTTTAGTIFPSTPADGNIFIYTADSVNGIKWAFQYDSGSASTYKWECIGGRPIRLDVDTSESTISTVNVDLATAQQITILRSGDYDIEWAAEAFVTGAAATLRAAITKAGVEQSSGSYGAQTINFVTDITRSRRLTGLAAGDVLKFQFRTSGNTGNFFNRTFCLTPVRVS